MFERIANGYALARSSWAVLLKDKHLLIFPFVSGLLFLIVVASFAVPLAALVDWNQLAKQEDLGRTPWWTYVVAFAFYFCTYFVTIFCNSALLSCTFLRFNGESPTVRDGFRLAMARLPQILAWAFISATVGVLLQIVEQLHEKVGEFIAWLLGTAWSVTTFFVVPVLVVEKVGPIAAFKRSFVLLKQTWGEALVGRAGIGFFLFLAAIPLVLLFAAGIFLIVSKMVAAGIALLIIAGVLSLVYMAVSSALHTILIAALYQFAADKQVPEGFDRHVFEGAFAKA